MSSSLLLVLFQSTFGLFLMVIDPPVFGWYYTGFIRIVTNWMFNAKNWRTFCCFLLLATFASFHLNLWLQISLGWKRGEYYHCYEFQITQRNAISTPGYWRNATRSCGRIGFFELFFHTLFALYFHCKY